ncbi:MAG: helix-turn-helix domain-containing protein [Propionibacterium sp.]|nr:helix-turn-helix domain-containing protein [Propionibacterium sp.]
MDLVLSAIQQQRRQTLTEVCQATGLPRTTVHRFLDHLVEMRWLSRVGNEYEFGVRMLELGTGDHHWFPPLAEPELLSLHKRTGLTVHLTFLDGAEVVVWKRFAGRESALLPTGVGTRHPAHQTASGKAILAAAEPALLATYSQGPLSAATAHSITEIEQLAVEVARIRQGGLARDHGESWHDVGCIAGALTTETGHRTRHGNPMIVAVSLTGPLAEVRRSHTLEPELRATLTLLRAGMSEHYAARARRAG